MSFFILLLWMMVLGSVANFWPSLSSDKLLTFEQVSALLPQRPHRNTIARWASRGYQGIVLRTHRCGRRRLVRLSDLEDFLAATSRLPRQVNRSAEHRKAADELDRAGI